MQSAIVGTTSQPVGGLTATWLGLFALGTLIATVASALAAAFAARAALRTARAATRRSLTLVDDVEAAFSSPMPVSPNTTDVEVKLYNDGKELLVLAKPEVREGNDFTIQSWDAEVKLGPYVLFSSHGEGIPVPSGCAADVRLWVSLVPGPDRDKVEGTVFFRVNPALDNGASRIPVHCTLMRSA